MRLGRFDIPLVRFPNAINEAKTIYESTVGMEDFHINDAAKAWNLASPNSRRFYRRLNSLALFGLETVSKDRYRITSLAKGILFPPNVKEKNKAYATAFSHVELWSRLYGMVKNNPPQRIFSQLSTITGAEPLVIKDLEKNVSEWYLEDLSVIPEDVLQKEYVEQAEKTNKFSSITNNDNKRDKNMALISETSARKIACDTEELEKIPFGKNIIIYLPKENKKTWWERAQKHMSLFLEEEEESNTVNNSLPDS